MATLIDYGQPRRVGYGTALRHAWTLVGGQLAWAEGLQGNFEEVLRCHAAIRENIHGDAIPRISRELALRIGQGGKGSIEPLAVTAEGEPQEKSLSCVNLKAGVGIVGKLIRL